MPSVTDFMLMSEFDQAYVIAYYRIRSTMSAYENWLHEEKMKRSNKGRGK